MTAAELLRQLNERDECPRIEAKTGSESGKSALKTVCALANEPRLGGGFLLFGVSRSDDLFGSRYDVVGVPNPDKLQDAVRCYTRTERLLRPQAASTESVEQPVELGWKPVELGGKSVGLGEKPPKLGEKSVELAEQSVELPAQSESWVMTSVGPVNAGELELGSEIEEMLEEVLA